MRTALVEEPDAVLRVAEQHQVLAHETDPDRRAIGLGDLV
jgi:hypothetical protein